MCCGCWIQDVHGGLEKAGSPELGWSNPARTIVHIADAPGHGTRLADPDAFWGRSGDNYPDHDADGKELTKLLHNLRVDLQVGVSSCFARCSRTRQALAIKKQ